jgi:DNA-binding NtrC family response regulator
MNEISGELSRQFMEYEWPGNIRQLENMIKRMVVLGGEAPILAELHQPPSVLGVKGHTTTAHTPMGSHVPGALTYPAAPAMPVSGAPSLPGAVASTTEPASLGSTSAAMPLDANAGVSLKDIARAAAREAERELILRMLTRTRWNRKEAAENLGISYKALLYKIKENGLDKAS